MFVGPTQFLVVGDVTRDFIAVQAEGQSANHLLLLNHLIETVGGKATNTARLLASLGGDVALASVVGSDAEPMRTAIARSGVDARHVLSAPGGNSSVYFAFHSADRSHTYYAPGSETGSDRDFAAQLLQVIETGPYSSVYVAVNHAWFAREALRRADARGLRTILSVHNVTYCSGFEHIRESLPFARWIVGNATEVETLCRLLGMDRAQILSQFSMDLITETLGEEGVRIKLPDREFIIPAPKVVVRDETGAGDAFLAGFLWGCVRSEDIEISARFGSVIASFAVECLGALSQVPPWQTIALRHLDCYGRPLPESIQPNPTTSAS